MTNHPNPKLRKLLHELNQRVLEAPGQKGRIIQDFYLELVRQGDMEAADEVLILRSIALAREDSGVIPAHQSVRFKHVRTNRRRYLAAAIGLLALAAVYRIVTASGENVSDAGPHPEFWPKLPPPGLNNVWYSKSESNTVFVFVHGIFSDSRGCWLARHPTDSAHDQYWPQLVQSDPRLDHPAIFLGGYATSFDSGPYDVRQAAWELRDALKREGVLQKRRILFISHSTGGIVTRFMLVRNQDLFQDKQIGLALYASPSVGSKWGSTFAFLSNFYGNKLGSQLRPDDATLLDLDKDFRDLLDNPTSKPNNLKIIGTEGVENFFILHRKFLPDIRTVVDEGSASRYFAAPRYLRGTDHFSAVKPLDDRHPAHELLLTFYDKFNNEYPVPPILPTDPAKPVRQATPTRIPLTGRPTQAGTGSIAGNAEAERPIPPVVASSAQPTVRLRSSASEIKSGDTVSLRWSASNAAEVRLDGRIVESEGEHAFTLLASKTFDIVASGPGGQSRDSVVVNVLPKVVCAAVTANTSDEEIRRTLGCLMKESPAPAAWRRILRNYCGRVSIGSVSDTVVATMLERCVQVTIRSGDVLRNIEKELRP